MCDEELRAIRVGSGVRHGKYARLIMLQARMKLIGEFITGTAGAFAGWVTALGHEIGDDAMKFPNNFNSMISQSAP